MFMIEVTSDYKTYLVTYKKSKNQERPFVVRVPYEMFEREVAHAQALRAEMEQ